jgi:subtilisin family serine protease
MAEKADLSAAYAIKDWSERGWFVYNTLKETAARTQAPVIAVLKASGLKYESFYAGNEIAVTGSGMAVLSQIAALDAVGHIRYPRTATIDPIDPLTQNLFDFSIDALDWGITDTNADDFWSAFGLQGDGIVVANIDTGVQWDHPALDQAFKCGTNPSDPSCWADPANMCGGSACDNNGHGTHTMGTMVGDDDPTLTYQVGMAPNAKWIACKGCESSSCSENALNACADWILAPGGSPDNRPNIVNNSWGGGGGDNWYLAKVQAGGLLAFPAFSAGNSGFFLRQLGSPGDYQEVLRRLLTRADGPSVPSQDADLPRLGMILIPNQIFRHLVTLFVHPFLGAVGAAATAARPWRPAQAGAVACFGRATQG